MGGLLSGWEHRSSIEGNHLFYGDNLTIMRELPTACVDLIYLDPPFNSQRNYNLIYKQATGMPVPEQATAFCDAWELDAEKDQLARDLPMALAREHMPEDVIQFWSAWIQALKGTQPRLLAYLVYMTYRLLEMRRILKPTGSIWLHCDPTASHYIKIIMDGVFGHQNFRNEVIWQRTAGKALMSRRLPNNHDILLCYQRSEAALWNADAMFQPYDESALPPKVRAKYSLRDADGRRYQLTSLINPSSDRPNLTYEFLGVTRVWRWTRDRMQAAYDAGLVVQPRPGGVPRLKRYLDEQRGMPLADVWTDIAPLNSQAQERLGYPTQKPIALLDRIIRACTDEEQVIFDPFAGCGTSIYAAHLSNRRWIGCDIAILSVNIVRDVLLKRYGLRESSHYHATGIPMSVDGARELFNHDPHQFQNWAVEAAGGFCTLKRSNDHGIDGRIYFETRDGLKSMAISVKGGKLSPAHVRELRGVLERDQTMLAGFICLDAPTRGMRDEAAQAGMVSYLGRNYERLQIRTVDDLLDGRDFDTPSRVHTMERERQNVLALQGKHRPEPQLAL